MRRLFNRVSFACLYRRQPAGKRDKSMISVSRFSFVRIAAALAAITDVGASTVSAPVHPEDAHPRKELARSPIRILLR
jgi:hypothetical protein